MDLFALFLVLLMQTKPDSLNPPLQSSPATRATQAASQPAAAAGRPASVGFLYRQVAYEGRMYAYSLFVPPDYTPQQAWPAILFLHGSGERGSDGFLQTDIGIARAIRRNYRRCPAIVVLPQCPAGQLWDEPMTEMALRCLQDASRDHRLDPQRLYLTGLSLGGAGSWLLAARRPGLWAAVAPVCGFIGELRATASDETLSSLGQALRDTPIWAFHGGADEVVPPERSREIVAAIQSAGGSARLTEFPNVKHNCWDQVYESAEFWRWLLSQRREATTRATTTQATHSEPRP